MTDYHELNDEQLQRTIAERLGYRIEVYADAAPPESYWYMYQLIDPDGHEVIEDSEYANEAEAWQDAPRWSTDANAALKLAKSACDDEWEFMLFTVGEQWVAGFKWFADGDFEMSHQQSHTAPARAICLAWLAYQDEKAKAHDQ